MCIVIVIVGLLTGTGDTGQSCEVPINLVSYSRPTDWYGGIGVNPVRCLLILFLIVGLLTGMGCKV